jgi:DNA anti-recombination protein RmuC
MAATCQIVDFQSHRMIRAFAKASERQGELARTLRRAADDRSRLATALDGAQRELSRIAESYTELLVRLEREKNFRDACLEATELGDLDEMVRRRDALAGELEAIREENRCPLFGRSE